MKSVTLFAMAVSLTSFNAFAADAPAPAPTAPAPAPGNGGAVNDPQRGCAMHYLLIETLDWNIFRKRESLKVVDLLADVDGLEGSNGEQLHRLVKQVRKTCFGTGLDDVRDIVASADDHYAFCQKVGDGHHQSYDLYTRKRIRDYVVAEMQRSRPELCR